MSLSNQSLGKSRRSLRWLSTAAGLLRRFDAHERGNVATAKMRG
jgi:preprotein translocase subunit Sec61beta